jgi:hypothetical protein
MKLGVAFLLLLVGTVSAAEAAVPNWNPKAADNGQLLPAFTPANVAAVLASVGARPQRSGNDPAAPALIATFPNGRRALLSMSACDAAGTRCKALSIQSFWNKLERATPESTAQAIQRFNRRYAFSKAFLTPDGRPSLQRYLTADYGFVRGNLAVNLLVFADQADRFTKEFLEPLERIGG